MNLLNQIKRAINKSIDNNVVVHILADYGDIDEVLHDIDCNYDTDYFIENDGSYDVWGWTDETKPNEQDWRLNIYFR